MFLDGGESATKKRSLAERKGGKALLYALRPGDGVLAVTPHRLFRNLLQSEMQTEEWDKLKISLHFVDLNLRTDTPNGKMMLRFLNAAAEWRSAIMAQRIQEKRDMQRGQKKGSPRLKELYPLIKEESPRVKARDAFTIASCAMIEDRLNPRPRKFTGVIRAYIRVSTADQTVEQQRDPIMRFLANQEEFKDAEIIWYKDEGRSAYSKPLHKRPAGKQVLEDLVEGDVMVFLRIDRATRRTRDIIQLVDQVKAKGSMFIAIDCNLRTDQPTCDLMIKMLALVAELESQENARSTGAAIQMAQMKNGISSTRLPLPLIGPTEAVELRKIELRTLLTAEEWRDFWEEMLQGAHQIEKAGKTSYRSFAAQTCIRFCRKIGWPCPRSCRSASPVKYWIEDAEKMQAEEFSPRREDLIRYLSKFDPEKGVWSYPVDPKMLKRIYIKTKRWLEKIEQCRDAGEISNVVITPWVRNMMEQLHARTDQGLPGE